MPTQNALATSDFLKNWDAFNNAVAAAQQWSEMAATLGSQLQADPNYSVVLTQDDQSTVDTAIAASSGLLKAIPMPTPLVIGHLSAPVNP